MDSAIQLLNNRDQAFCFNLSFSFKSFFFFSKPFLLSSVSVAVKQLRISSSSSGDSYKNDKPIYNSFYIICHPPHPGVSCKNDQPTHINCLIICKPIFSDCMINQYDELIFLSKKASYFNKMLKALSHQELRRQSRNR